MAILKKTLFDEKLESYGVFIEDTAPNSQYFKVTELPDVFTGGKNAFLIQGSQELDADSIVKIQIRDSQGNIIYHEPGEGIPEYYEGTSKVVAVYIYPDTTFGPCTITILGELKEYNSNGLKVPVPENWRGVYNVRWQKTINVNPLLQNTTKIRFYRRPKVDVQEVIFPIYNIQFDRITISGSVTGTALSPAVGDNFRFFKGDTLYELNSPISTFSSSMEGENITINGLPSGYSPTIKEVVTSTKALVSIPYYETSSTDPNAYQNVLDFSLSPFTLSFDQSSTLTDSSISASFAKITLSDLETFSGDVNRVKVYASRLADIGNFTLLEDIKLESNEILLSDSFSGSINVRTGQFSSQNIIDSFWKYKDYAGITDYSKTIDNGLLVASVKLLDLNTQNTAESPQKIFYYSSSLDFTKNTEYQLSFNLLLSSSLYSPNKISIYGSGSSFVNSDDTLPLGKLIGEISTDKTFRRFDRQEFNFKPDSDGSGTIVFAVHQGNWQVSNIGLRASQETNFSPNEVSLNVSMPTVVNNDVYDFKFEFYDINNNYVPVLVEKVYTFQGGTGAAAEKAIELSSDINIFIFSGSGEPIGATSTTISVEKTNLSGSVTFYSSAFDVNGNYLSPSLYAGGQYPGLLTNVTETSTLTTATLTAANFTGSLGGVKVTRVLYTASCDVIDDKLNIYRLEEGGAGADGANAVQYVIRPLNGTALKNNSGTLELQLSKIDGTSLIDLNAGNIKLVTGSLNTIINVGGGVTAGANGLPYNAVFDSTKISGSLLVKAYDFDTNSVVDSITIVDVSDGIPAGVINSSNGLTFVRQTNNGFFFSPENSKVTASFFSATGTEVSESISITASYSGGSDYFTYNTLIDNPSVGLIVRAADGTLLSVGVPKATRTISTQFTYSSLRVSETFNIMVDGASGSNGATGSAAKTVNLTSPYFIISYDKDGLTPSPSALFPITASAINFTSPYFRFTGDVNTPEGTYTVGSSSTEDTASFTPPSSYFTTPKTFRVGVAEATAPTVEIAYDTITIAAVKVGQSGTDGLSSQFYFIRPLSGSQIRNSQGTLELQAVWVSGSTSIDLKSGSVVLASASVSTAVLRSGSGVTSGSNAVQFNAKFNANSISGSRIVYLYDTGSNKLYDTITLIDTNDGVAAGSVIADTLIFRRDPNNNLFTPTTASVTASFFGTNGTEYQERYRVYPFYESSLDKMYFTLDSDNAQITASVDDGGGNRISSGFANRITTKDLNFRFTFIDPQTADSASAIETFYIISDGQDGDDAYTVILTNDSHTLPTTNTGTVTYTNSGTNILVYKGTTQLQATTGIVATGFYSASVSSSTNITPGTLSVVGLAEVVADHSSMTADQASVLYKINCEGTQSVLKLQTLSKANQGAASKTVNLTSPYYVISYDKDGLTPSPTALFPITASAINFVSPYFRFTGDVNTIEATYTAGSSSSEDSASFTPPSSYFTTPKTFRVGVAEASAPTVELAYDTITIAAVKAGSTGETGGSTQFYFIRPLSGSQIKNSQGTLELQAVWISGSTTFDLKSGSIVLTTGSVATAVLRSGSGVTSGSNAVQFNAKFNATAISGSRIVYLYDTGSNRLYDSITLVDASDGVAAGSVLADTLIFRRDPNNNLFTPTTASVTASFFGTNGTEYQERYRVYPIYESSLDKMYFTLDSDNAQITASVDDGSGNRIASGFANRITTKDLNFRFTFIDPQTADSASAIETFYIISDGQDGDDAYTVVLTNDSHTLPTTNTGSVTYTNSGTNISVYKGATQLQATTGTVATGFYSASVSSSTNITAGAISVVGLNAVVADHSSMTADQASILYKVVCEGTQSVLKLQTLSKATQGASAKSVNLNSPYYIISYDKDGSTPSPSALFPITASAINFVAPYFRFTGDVNTPEGTYTVGSSSTEDTASFTPPASYFSTPKTFRVGVSEAATPNTEIAYDTITIAAVRVGSTGETGGSTQFYFIRPVSGSQLRNSQGTLELQAVWISGSTTFDLKSGSIVLTTGSVATAVLRSGSGVTSGSNPVQFNAVFNGNSITGSRTIYLYDTGSNRLYDSITLVDVNDGLAGGSVIANTLFTRRETAGGGLYTYNPTTLPFTASFVGTSGLQYNTRITLYPSYSVTRNVDSMYYTLDASTASVSFTVDDGSGNLFAGAGASNYRDTKDATFNFTFTDPQTNDTSKTLETFYIVSDGIDGDDAYTVVLTNEAHTAPTTNTGTVTYTNSGTSIIAYRGATELNGITSGTPLAGQFSASLVASNITAGTVTSTGNPIVVGDHSAMTADLATITYTINLEGTSSVTKVQTISKARQGNDGQMNLAYVITPVSGTILKNKTGTLELRITRLSGSAVNEISGGSVVLVTGSANLPISVGGGITAGPNGVLWNGIFDTTKISGSLVVKARDTGSGITYDTITLADITDGLTAGTINATNGLILTRNPNTLHTYTPTTTAFTASFYDVKGNLYTSSLLITPNYSYTLGDQLKYTISQTNANMTLSVRDAAGTTVSNDTFANTTGLNVRYVFVDPFSGDVVDCIETARIAVDGGKAFILQADASRNQFIYDPDNQYAPATTNEYIDITLKTNLTSGSLSIRSGSNLPRLALISTANISEFTQSVYRLFSSNTTADYTALGNTNASSWSYHTPASASHSGTYVFTQVGFTSSVTVEGVLKGDKSKNLDATSDINQFTYKMTDASLTPSGQTINISVKRNNLGSTTNTISVASGSGKPVLTVGSNNSSTGVQSYSLAGSSYPYSTGATTYTFTAQDLNSVTYTDSITINPIIIESQVSFDASNENTSLPAQSTGWVASGSFLLTSGSVSVKVGTEDIVFASPISNNKFSASISQSSNVGTATITNNNYSIGVLTQDSGSLLLKIVYQDARGIQVSGSKVVTYSKSKASRPNIEVAVSPAAQTITSNSRGSGSATPTTLTLTALEGGTSRFTSIGTPTYTNGLAGSVSSNTIVFSSNATSMTSDTGTITIPVNFTDSENTPGTQNVVATVTRTRTAAPTTLAILSSETQTVPSSSNVYGAPNSFTVTVNEGGSNYSYDAALSTNSTYYISSITGGSNSSGTITPTTPTTDSGTTVSLTISYKNSEGTTGTINKTHIVTVSKQGNVGATGATGATGADGKRTATGMVNYQISSSTVPSTPSATTYTFSTGQFTGLTANWGLGAPIYSGSNSAKYWYSTYTAVETTAGGGTATPTFGTPVQAIGFSGLVSFTSANSVNDGTGNTLSFGVAGATLINGSNISTGKILSTNYIAGSPYTTSGSIFDLDNGRIATKAFYVDSAGDAGFRGNITFGARGSGINIGAIGLKYNPSSSAFGGVSGSSLENAALNGNSTENSFNYINDPFGKTSLGVECYPSGDSNADGGWNSYSFRIDNNKTYKFICYFKKYSSLLSSAGNLYWGTNGYSANASTNIGLYTIGTSPTLDTNAYFYYGGLPELNKWYLIVGYVHGKNYSGTTNIGGVYDTVTGEKVTSFPYGLGYVQDYKWHPDNLESQHRAYLYYNTIGNGITKYQEIWGPAVYEVDGNEPELDDLLDKAKLLADGTLTGGTFISNDTIFSPKIAGVDGYFSGKVSVGSGSAPIVIDGISKKLYQGTGSYANANTSFYLDSEGKFSLKDRLQFDGTNLLISGTVSANQGSFGGWNINSNGFSNGNVSFASGLNNYIQITGDAGSSFAGNRVFIHSGSLSKLSAGSSVDASTATSYVDVTAISTEYFGNSGTTVTIGTAGITTSTLATTATYNIKLKLRTRFDINWGTAQTTASYDSNSGNSTINSAAYYIAYYTKYVDPGGGDPRVDLTRVSQGWIADYTAQAFDFIDRFNKTYNKSFSTAGSLSQIYNDSISTKYIDFTTALNTIGGSSTLTQNVSYKGAAVGTITSTITPTSQLSNIELDPATVDFNSLGDGTNPITVSLTKSNTLDSNYRRRRWEVGYFDGFDFYGDYVPGGYGCWADILSPETISATVTYNLKGFSFVANALTKQVEISEQGLQAVFNADTSSLTGNFLLVSDVGTPSTSNFNIKTAGYFAHYGELHTKGNIVAYSTSLSSDKNLKSNISPIGKSELNLLDLIDPIQYTWKDDKENKIHYGFIAQDVQKVYPNMADKKIMGEYLTVNYIEFIPLLLAKINELEKEIGDLKKRIE